jgi:hypothetical protein
MKAIKLTVVGLLLATVVAAPFSALAVDKKTDTDPAKKAVKAKPYALKTCIVSDEKLGEMGPPYTFTYKDREIKMCCKDCKKDFDKDPAKFMTKLAAAEKKAAQSKPSEQK